ncbi:hypothetical protein LCGC14_0448800 [marine sediment metagenome]|uniref:Vitamin B12-dependent ribonucleotide reductase n=1 Tax=marine sediment metagenome TaxID=412755 RepID=A0A0F9SNY7_9ZZZZ
MNTEIKQTEVSKELFGRRYQWKEETYSDMLARVAGHIALAEKPKYRSKFTDGIYNLMASGDFMFNSPTLFNAGTGQGLLSACFVLIVEDSLVSIMECNRLAGLIMKFGGGVGYGLSRVRAEGEPIKSVQGRACGPIALLPFYNETAKLVTQGGRRSGAQMGILSIDHPNIKEFIHFKDEHPDELHTFNISVAITDEFMKRYKAGDPEARARMREIAESSHKTGDPGVFFIDNANKDNPTPWLGRLEATNPCGEVPLYHGEACNLGSINLGHYVKAGGIDYLDMEWAKLKADITLAVKALDNVIDVNDFPDPIISKAVALTRKIGLGVMGYADALAIMGIEYDSQRAVDWGSKISLFIQDVADKASYDLAIEKGIAPAFKNSPDKNIPMRRNTTRTCIAPTGSISQLVGCSSGIEPFYELEYTRTMYDKGIPVELHVREPVLDLLQEHGLNLPKTAHEVSPKWHIAHQAAWQSNVNLAVSKTINLPETATVKEIEASFVHMWELGCKGGTCYRDKSRDVQVLSKNRQVVKGQVANNRRLRLPDERKAIIHKFRVGEQEGYIAAGMYDDGTLGEVFIKMAKEGSTLQGLSDALGISTSLLLQNQVPIGSIAPKYIGSRFEPAGMTDNPDIPITTSLIDYIFRWLYMKFGNGDKMQIVAGLFCPDCNSELIYQEGCLKCRNKACGYEKCG